MAQYDEFELHNKRKVKMEKTIMKNNLRNTTSQSKKMIESQEDSNDDGYIQKIMGRGTEWWNKADYRFFRSLSPQQIKDFRIRTTSEKLLGLKRPALRLNSYLLEKIALYDEAYANPTTIKILFRREIKINNQEDYFLVSYIFKQYEEASARFKEQIDKKIHILNFHNVAKKNIRFNEEYLNYLSIEPVSIEDSKEVITNLLRFQVKKKTIPNEIQREIDLWSQELVKINNSNLYNWQFLLQKMKKVEARQISDFDEQINEIKKKLRMTQVLLYFKRGHGDKTQQMLEDALQITLIKQMSMQEQFRKKKNTKIQRLKCLFQTDCKICFCTESDDKNRVLYCDICNTSFHQACYGIKQIQNDQKFYCEVCSFLQEAERTQGTKLKKPICQICYKSNFPMKLLGNHFYHVTCLVLFNLVEIKNFEIQFKKNMTEQKIFEKIVENQFISNYCQFCLKDCGMKFKCIFPLCETWFHPICAYLNGFQFELTRSYHSLNVQIACSCHYPQRDMINQIYLRRFFCDYKGTSNLNDVDFDKIYQAQVQDRKNNLLNRQKDQKQGYIIKKGRTTKFYKCFQTPRSRNLNKQKKQISVLNKKESVVSGQDLSQNIQTIQIETETRKILKRMRDNPKQSSFI